MGVEQVQVMNPSGAAKVIGSVSTLVNVKCLVWSKAYKTWRASRATTLEHQLCSNLSTTPFTPPIQTQKVSFRLSQIYTYAMT